MKKFFKLREFKLALATLGIAAVTFAVCATLPTYKTVSAYGMANTNAYANFPADPNSQIRIIYVNYGSDSNTASIGFMTGTTAYQITQTNGATSSVTNLINSTNGLSASTGANVLVLQHGGSLYQATIASWNAGTNFVASSTNAYASGGTNVVLATGGWGVATSIGDDVYLMSSLTSWPVGVGTNVISGDAVYVGNYGRPVIVQLGLALATNKLYSVSAHYDSQSQ